MVEASDRQHNKRPLQKTLSPVKALSRPTITAYYVDVQDTCGGQYNTGKLY